MAYLAECHVSSGVVWAAILESFDSPGDPFCGAVVTTEFTNAPDDNLIKDNILQVVVGADDERESDALPERVLSTRRVVDCTDPG